jgi:hypothetical protein
MPTFRNTVPFQFFLLSSTCVFRTQSVSSAAFYIDVSCVCVGSPNFLIILFLRKHCGQMVQIRKKISCVLLCFFASFCCCVSSCRSLIGDRSRGQVKRLSPMNVEVMGNTAAGAGRWLEPDGRSAAASFASCLTSRSSWRLSSSLLFHFVTLMRYLVVLLHIPYAVLCYLFVRASESGGVFCSWPVFAWAAIAQSWAGRSGNRIPV